MKMLDTRKRPAAYNPEFWGSKRRKTSSSLSSQESMVLTSPQSPRSVVALLALTDPTIVTRVMHFIPHTGHRKRGEATNVVGTLVNLCRAIAPFDRELPRHFGPTNHAFWQEMVLRYFDFTTRLPTTKTSTTTSELDEREPRLPYLAVWTQLGVSFVPSEYGFLQKLQSARDNNTDAAWPRKENAFTLYCDLTILVDKLRGLARVTPANTKAQRFLPCLRRPGAIDATSNRPPPTNRSNSPIPFLGRIRRSRRDVFTQVVTCQLQNWKHFRDQREPGSDSQRVDFYAGQSRRSTRWIGLTSVRQRLEEETGQ